MKSTGGEGFRTEGSTAGTLTVDPHGGRDPVTGLLNRDGFMYRMAQFDRTAHGPAILATIRVIAFPTIQQVYGEAAARLVLAHVGGILFKHFSRGELIGHAEDGDFPVLLPDANERGLRTTVAHLQESLFRKPLHLPAGAGIVHVKIVCAAQERLEAGTGDTKRFEEAIPPFASNTRPIEDRCDHDAPDACVFAGMAAHPHHAAA